MRTPPDRIRFATLTAWCLLVAAIVSAFMVDPLRSDTTAVAPPRRADSTLAMDPIARLQAKLDAGSLILSYDSAHGYLPALLRALDIPITSQGLVFSRTSLQTDKIAPWAPRALYYNDDVYVGFVQESHFLEIASMHPTRGAMFYTLSQEPRGRPTFSRETTTCLMCHQSRAATGGVRGLMVLSTVADRFGYPIVGAHDGTTTDATPIRQRFGGWYVTGSHGDSASGDSATTGHSGNVWSPRLSHEVADKQAYRTRFDLTTESRRLDLSDKFDPSPYLSRHSDIVAMMVLVHQTTVHNLMTAVHEAVQDASLRTAGANATSDATPTGPSSVRVQGATERLVKAMLFVDEAPLRGVMRGSTNFVQDFSQRGPRDRAGRSLRDFDLKTRLFKYPLSFLIYSDGFAALPVSVRREIYQQIDRVLRDSVTTEYPSLSLADRAAIRSILSETLPEYLPLRRE